MPVGEFVTVVVDGAHVHLVAAWFGKDPVRVDMKRTILNALNRMGTVAIG